MCEYARATQMSASDEDTEGLSSSDGEGQDVQRRGQRKGAVVRSRPEAPTLLLLSDILGSMDCGNDTAKLDAVLANQMILAKALNVVLASVQDVKQGLTKTREHLNKHDMKTTSSITVEAAKKWFEERLVKDGIEEALEPVNGKAKERFLEEKVYPRLGFTQTTTREDRVAMAV